MAKNKQRTSENNKESLDEKNETIILLQNVITNIDDDIKNKEKSSNKIITGFEKLDQVLIGFRNGDLNIIASRPGIGKSLFALNIFANRTMEQNKNALYITFEKEAEELLKDMISMKFGIDTQKMNSGYLSDSDFRNLIDATSQIYNCSSIFVKKFYNTDLIKLKSFIKEKIEKDKIKIIFIDYLTMIVSAPIYSNRWEQVSEISRSLKSMAMEFNIPFVVMSPLNRSSDDKSPEINDLSESGSIEYDADRVIILFSKYNKKKKDREENEYLANDITNIAVYIAKNRHGPKALLDFSFIYKKKIVVPVRKE
jgi:replicative DNA helicase